MQPISYELQISARVTLKKGDSFRATGGPYWKTKDGRKIALSAKGPFKFHRFVLEGRRSYVEAFDRDGAYVMLYYGRTTVRSKTDESIVLRPYRLKRIKGA